MWGSVRGFGLTFVGLTLAVVYKIIVLRGFMFVIYFDCRLVCFVYDGCK